MLLAVPTYFSTLLKYAFASVRAALPATAERGHFSWIRETPNQIGTVLAKLAQGLLVVPNSTRMQMGGNGTIYETVIDLIQFP